MLTGNPISSESLSLYKYDVETRGFQCINIDNELCSDIENM